MEQNTGIPTLNHLFFRHLDHVHHDRLLSGGDRHYSSEDFARAVFALRQFLWNRGLAGGERIAIFAENRPEWHIADFAILLSGNIVVPLYPTLAGAPARHVLEHSGCRAVIFSGQAIWQVLKPLLTGLPQIVCVIGMDDVGAAGVGTLAGIIKQSPAPTPSTWQPVRAEALSTDPGTTATIVYTSGTTGTPKGVMLSHRNIVFNLEQGLRRIQFETATQALSVLPLSHVFERLLCYGYFRLGVPIAYGDPHDLRDLLRQYRPKVMGCVPRILEKVKETIDTQINSMPSWRRALAHSLLKASLACTRRPSSNPSLSDRLLYPLAKLLLAARIHRQMGGLDGLICGGAWLDPEVENFFRAVGFRLLQGYGLTETSPVICLNQLGCEKPGSVGPPLDGVEVRLSADGEVLTRGPHVMQGYYRDEAATREAFDGDWLRTGDMGHFDEQGRLILTGRRKEILVLSTGKNVSCALLEQALQRSPYIQQAFVIGEGRKFVTALIIPNRQKLAHDTRAMRLEDLLLTPAVVALFREQIATCQAEFAHYEQVKRFSFLDEEVLLDGELMTPTQKMRRNALTRRFAPWIERMYQQEEPLVMTLSALPEQPGIRRPAV